MDKIKEIKKKKLEEMKEKIAKPKGKVVESTSVKEFLQKSKERLVLVDFYADWCAPCKALSPSLEKIAKEMGFLLVKVNVDRAKSEASKFGVRGIPSVFFIKDGKMVDQFVGARDPEFIKTKVRKWL